jgi:L-ascorbate metabolism protein UlaG (beta-lactamase superfamily)
MIRCTCLGHATLLVEGDGTRILMDPVLKDYLSGGGNRFNPPRIIDESVLREPFDAVVVSHSHDDHFYPPDIETLPGFPDTPFLIPRDPDLETALRHLGASNVRCLEPWDVVRIGSMSLTATPSEVPFPEMGVAIETRVGTVLNLVDSVFASFAEALAARFPKIMLALIPFQAGGYLEFFPLRVASPPSGLVAHVKARNADSLATMRGTLEKLKPVVAAPFADGLRYVDDPINSWHFPLSDSHFFALARGLGITAHPTTPGSTFQLSQDRVHYSASSPRVKITGDAHPRHFNPHVRIPDQPLRWIDSADTRLRRNLSLRPHDATIQFIQEALGARAKTHTQCRSHALKQRLRNWDLELLNPSGETTTTLLIADSDMPAVYLQRNPFPSRPYGLRFYADDLAAALDGSASLNYLLHGGHFRYRSPDTDAPLEDVYECSLGLFLDVFNWA